jgi:hypothetical protein
LPAKAHPYWLVGNKKDGKYFNNSECKSTCSLVQRKNLFVFLFSVCTMAQTVLQLIHLRILFLASPRHLSPFASVIRLNPQPGPNELTISKLQHLSSRLSTGTGSAAEK